MPSLPLKQRISTQGIACKKICNLASKYTCAVSCISCRMHDIEMYRGNQVEKKGTAAV